MMLGISRRSLLASSVGFGLGERREELRSFHVLGLLHPKQLCIRPYGATRLHCESLERKWAIEGSQSLLLSPSSGRVVVTGPEGRPADFLLQVPGVITRSYRGVLRVSGQGQLLQPVVEMDSETATGSVVGAELPARMAAFDALAAQAVVSRSVLLACDGRRHADFDFCDTTHCQYLRSPAPAGSLAERAVNVTRDLVLMQQGRIIFARYSSSCGGSTEGGSIDGVRYSSVRCDSCCLARRARQGHGWGLCQHGAMALADRGVPWSRILAVYFPHATLQTRILV